MGKNAERRRNILIVASLVAATILLVGANVALILARPAATHGRPGSIAGKVVASAPRVDRVERRKPLEVCEDLAPKAAAAYTGKDGDRDRLIRRYFTSDAQGLGIPASRIADQPDVRASGGMNSGSDTTATCSVWTGLESPWTLTWQWSIDGGWKCTGISGPLEGAYTVPGDKAPQEDGGQ